MSVSRREFLKFVSGGAALLALEMGLAGGPRAAVARVREAEAAWAKAPCRFCGTGCGVLVGTAKGHVVAVKGDPESPVNRGLLCVKGYHLPEILYGADRLTRPQARRKGRLENVSWDQAMGLLADRFKSAIDRHGRDSVAIYGSGQWTIHEGYAALKLMKAGIGTNNIEANARLCMASAVTGFMSTFGADEPSGCYDDLDLADAFVLWGANMAEMHPVLFSRMLDNRAKHNETKIVDITVRRSPTSQEADVVVMMKPQGDLALANGITRLLIEEGRIDPAFIKRHVVFKAGTENPGNGTEENFTFQDQPRLISFEEFRQFLAPYTPERVEELCGVPPAQLRQLAEIYGTPGRKVMSLWTMGINQHTRGTWMNNLIYNLHLLTGKIGKPGSTAFSLTGQPSACGTVREVGTLCDRLPAGLTVRKEDDRKHAAEIWKVPADRIPAKPGPDTVAMFRALARGDIKVMWIQCTNPFQTMPNLPRYLKAFERDDVFVAVSDVYPTATTDLAHLVLPSALWVEKEGMVGNSERRTQQWDKMTNPPGEARSDLWQIVDLARRLGHGQLFDYGDRPLEESLFEEYRRFGLGHAKDLAPYQSYRRARGLRWPVVDGKETRRRYVEGEDPYVPRGAGLYFYGNKQHEGRAVVWARPWEPPAESPDAEYPFWLCTGRVLEHWHTGTLTRRVPDLHRAQPAAYCEMHPEDAERLSVSHGERVRLASRRGSLVLTVQLSERSTPQKGMVFVPFFDEGLLVNLLTLDATCPISRQPDYKKCAVRVEKVKP